MRTPSLIIIAFLSATVFSKAEIPSEDAPVVVENDPIVDEVVAKATYAFAVPEVIERDVDFWAKVYREWDTNQVVIYDSQSKVIYRVLTLPGVGAALSGASYPKKVQAEVAAVKEHIQRALDGKTPDEKSSPDFVAMHNLLKQNDLLKSNDLIERLRQQNGLRSQFENALKISGRYLDDMTAVLRWQNLPDELVAMVFVESLFNLSTVSHAGAAGPWGIMRNTAPMLGIHVNRFTDERIDPVVATLGASRYLKKAKENLSEWPLVVTSYNYGYPGMLRAVSNLGSKDFAVILDKHDSPIFKYASKSYYAEFLAALDTIHNQHNYFPNLKKDTPWQYDVVQVQRPLAVEDMIAFGAVKKDDLVKLNPSLSRLTISGAEILPSDYAFRVPKGQSSKFYAQIKKIPTSKRNAASHKISFKHQARSKESLRSIAKKFGINGELFSGRMGKSLDYQPSGPVIIRSQFNLFSPLLEINKGMLASIATGQALTKPPEISTGK